MSHKRGMSDEGRHVDPADESPAAGQGDGNGAGSPSEELVPSEAVFPREAGSPREAENGGGAPNEKIVPSEAVFPREAGSPGEETGSPGEETGSPGETKNGGETRPASRARTDRRGGPRFGIGAGMLMITVLAFQYALINYFGPVAAMAIPPLICGGMIVVVLGFEIAATRSRQSRARQWSGRNFGWVVGYIFVLGISAYLTGGAQLGYRWFSQWRLERQVQKDLGFRHTTAYVWGAKRQSRKAVVLLLVEPGGPLDQAGLIAGETLLTELTPADWFRMVDENRGQTIQVRVAQGALGRALEKCPQRTVELRIPP